MSGPTSIFEKHPGKTLLCAVVVVSFILDLGSGQIYKQLKNTAQSKSSDIGTQSPIYHHDLASKLVGKTDYWGPFRFSVFTNSLGFRDRDQRTVPLTSPKVRWVFIGDSFTYGIGIDYSYTFVGIVQEIMRSKNIEVFNAGVSSYSYSPIIYYRKVKHLIEDVGFTFDELIVFMDVSDPHDEMYSYRLDSSGNVAARKKPGEPDDTSRDYWWFGIYRWITDNSLTCGIIFPLMRHHMPPLPINITRSKWTIDPTLYQQFGREGLELCGQYMTLLHELLVRHKVGLTVVVYPWPDQIYYKDRNSHQVRYWRSWAEQQEVRFLDLFPVFLQGDDPMKTIKQLFLRGDPHWNNEGHELVATTFLKFSTDFD